jgi:hypothetical protein
MPSHNIASIRYAKSSLNGKKICNWIQLCLIMTEIAKKSFVPIQYEENMNIENFISFIKNNDTSTWLDNRKNILSSWIEERYNLFNTNQ